MVRNFWEKQARRRPVDAELGLVAVNEQAGDPWHTSCQKTVLDHTWEALKDIDRKSPAYNLMRLRTEFPDDSSEQLAERLSNKIGSPVKPDACRQMLRRASLKFVELLLEEVRLGLDDPSPARVEEELAALERLDLIQDFLPANWRDTGTLVKE